MNAMKTSWKQAVLAVAVGLLLAGCGGSAEQDMEAQKTSQTAGPMHQEGDAEKDAEARKLVLAAAVGRFVDDCMTLPDSLGELLDSGKAGWKGPYLEDPGMLLDPWGREFIYMKTTGLSTGFRASSFPPDRKAPCWRRKRRPGRG